MAVSGLRLDLHNHTVFSSDGLMSPALLLETAKARGIGCIAITDHNTVRGGLEGLALAEADISLPRVIPGIEISTRAGEIIGLYVSEDIPRRLSLDDTVDQVRQQGGLVYLPHPFDRLRRGVIASRERDRAAESADIVEVVNGRSLSPWAGRRALCLSRIVDTPGGAGSDAHRVSEVGRACVVIDAMPTRETLVRLVATGRVEHGLRPVDYLFNWVFQGISPITRLRRKSVP